MTNLPVLSEKPNSNTKMETAALPKKEVFSLLAVVVLAAILWLGIIKPHLQSIELQLDPTFLFDENAH